MTRDLLALTCILLSGLAAERIGYAWAMGDVASALAWALGGAVPAIIGFLCAMEGEA